MEKRNNKIRWKVKGLDRESGEARSTLVFGANETEARNAAGDQNIVVETIEKLITQPKPTETSTTSQPQIIYVGPGVWKIAWGIVFGFALWIAICATIALLFLLLSLIAGLLSGF